MPEKKKRTAKKRTAKKRATKKTSTKKRATKKRATKKRASSKKKGAAKPAAEQQPDDEKRRPGSRSLWSGMITFGLVSIPVELFPAVRTTPTGLRMVDAEGNPLSRRYFCPRHDDAPLERDDLVRGYPVDDESFAVVTDDELEELAPDKSRRIELTQFVGHDEIDPRYVRSSYILAPAGDITQPYHLLASTMEETDRVGIATFVMRGHAYVVAIRAESGILRADTLRYADELRDPEQVGIDAADDADEDEVAGMVEAIESLAADELDPDELRDAGAQRLFQLVEAKRQAKEDLVAAPEALETTKASVLDLMEVLKERLSSARPRSEAS